MKKLIGILLVFCMLQGFTEVFAAEEKAADCQAVMLFKTLGITDDEFKSEEYMTRAEFTALTVRAMGKDNMPAGEVSYKDVSPEDTYYNEIAIADTLGIISKSDTFEPDKPITYEEAAKILVCMLGYEYPAEQKGGYALGYISMANDKKLFDNLLFRMGANVSGAEGATMIRNAWESEYMEYDFSENGYTESDELYMNKYLDIYKSKGILTSDGILDFDNRKIADGKVKIDGTLYKNSADGISEYFGEEIVYYYKQTKDEDEGTLLYAEPSKSSEILTVNDEDISEKTTASEFVYTVRESDKSKKLAADVKVIYNGKQEFAYTREMLMPKVGKVKLIDNDGDDVTDTVIVYDYETVVVNTYNSGIKKIVLKFSAEPIDLDAYDFSYIEKNGEKIGADALEEWDVLNVCKSDKKFIAYVSNESVSGKITAVSNDADETTLTVDDEKAPLSEKFIEKSGELKVGNKGIFYKDIMGRIVCADYNSTSGRNYSVILKAKMEESAGNTAIFKFFTKNNKKESAKGAEKIKINGTPYKPQAAVDKVNQIGLYQLVVTDSNEKGEITKIDFAEDKSEADGYKGYDNDNFTLDKNIPEVRFYNNTGAGCHVTSSTIFFSIPQDKTDEELYKAQDYKRVYDMDTTINNVQFYDLDKFNRPSCVVISDYDLSTPPGQENVDLQDEIFIVSDIYQVIDGDGEERTRLCGYHKDSYKEYYIAEEGAHNVSNFMTPNGPERMGNPVPQNDRTMWGFVGHDYKQIKKGDIMQLGYNADDDVAFYRMLWSSELRGTKIHTKSNGTWGGDDLIFVDPGELYEINENPGSAQNPNFMSMGYTSYGEIMEAQDAWFRYKTTFMVLDNNSVKKSTVERSIRNENSVYIIKLQDKGASVTKGSVSDITPGDKCFVHSRDNHCWYMALIRGAE